ncbi:hypothetical protein [Streptomyces albicerus]|uniref:hypothetical protein n=1 Tax=Streptomyces albicerus TaxID=2569859 RepID=UPI001788A6ED|nr:hypothetical protein [Streptomyces albicerus]
MADEQYRWLDRDAAERLLRGEPLETVDADTRDQADRLAEALDALGALTAEPAPTSTELPGEAAALAAFRKAHTGKNVEQASLRTRTHSAPSTSPTANSTDAGLIRLGRSAANRRAPSGWGRPMRYGLAAALTAGMIGGVAVTATSDVLPFGGDEPEPAASATVAVTPDRPFLSPSPEKTPGGGADTPKPDGSTGGPTAEGSAPRGEARGDADAGTHPGSDDARPERRPGHGWPGLASACRDHRDGKHLDSDRRRSLEDAANGAEQVKKYCKGILKNWHGSDAGDDRDGHGNGKGGPGRGNTGTGHDDEDDDGPHIGPGMFRGDDGPVHRGDSPVHPGGDSAETKPFAPALPAATGTPPRAPEPTPDVSALARTTASVAPAMSAPPRPAASAPQAQRQLPSPS